MRAIIEGQIHELLGEPSPRDIHDLHLPCLPVPELLEDHPGELSGVYRANGRTRGIEFICRPDIPIFEVIGRLSTRGREQLSQGASIGPIIRDGVVRNSGGGFSGICLWLPPKIGVI